MSKHPGLLYVPGLKDPVTVDGLWSGWHIVFMLGGHEYFARSTEIAVKGMNVPVMVTVYADGTVEFSPKR
jgi:hypothetical protein